MQQGFADIAVTNEQQWNRVTGANNGPMGFHVVSSAPTAGEPSSSDKEIRELLKGEDFEQMRKVLASTRKLARYADAVVEVLNSSPFKDDNGDGQQYFLPASRKRSCVVAQACDLLLDIVKGAEGCAQALQAGAVPTLTQTIERHRIASQVCHLSALRALRQIADTVAQEGSPSLSNYRSQLQDAAPTVRESMSILSDGHTKREGTFFLESLAGARPSTRVAGAGQKRGCQSYWAAVQTSCSLM